MKLSRRMEMTPSRSLASRPLFVKTETGSDHARREALASRADAVDHHVVAATSAGDLMILPHKAHTMTVPPPILGEFFGRRLLRFRVHLRLAARLRLRQRVKRSRSAAISDSRRAAFLQRRRRGRTTFVHCVRLRRHSAGAALDVSRAAVGTTRSALRHRQCRRLLDHPANRRLLKND